MARIRDRVQGGLATGLALAALGSVMLTSPAGAATGRSHDGALASVSSASPSWSGTWRLKPPARAALPFYGGNTVVLVQRGSKVTGRFDFEHVSDKGFGGGFCRSGKGGVVKGTAAGRSLRAKFIWPARGGHPRAVAPIRATLSRNGRTFQVDGQVTEGECGNFGAYLSFTAVRVRR